MICAQKIISQLNSINFWTEEFNNSVLVITNKKMEAIYLHFFKDFKKNDLFELKRNFSEYAIGYNVISLSKDKKSIAIITAENNNNEKIQDMSSISCPIQKENGEIIGYVAFFTYQSNINCGLVSFVEIISKLLFEHLKYYRILEGLNININQDSENIYDKITNKELEIMRLITFGKADKEIAQDLNISLSTVRKYIGNIFDKLNIESRSQIVSNYFKIKIAKAIHFESLEKGEIAL